SSISPILSTSFIFLSVYISTYKLTKYSFTIILICTIFISNFGNLFISSNLIRLMLIQSDDIQTIYNFQTLPILFKLPINKIIDNYIMIIIGFFIGITLKYLTNSLTKASQWEITIHQFIDRVHNIFFTAFNNIQYFISNYLYIFIYLLLVGVFLNIIHTNILSIVLIQYYQLIILIFILYFILFLVYIYIIYQRGEYSIYEVLQNLITPVSIGGPAMSSGLAIPSNIKSTIKNTNDPAYSNFIIPILTNTHLAGDTIILPVINMLILFLFNYPMPDMYLILLFSFYTAIYKFSSAGVPGGGIIVIHGLLVYFFNYSSEMLSIITSIYILLDIICTIGNIAFNNLLSIILYKYYK
ncbi:MAG: cation:dicarboxylase symporter family transporter, partial [Pseudomonadota bacterium]